MEKKFKLPKVFAIKWLEALRSEKYSQGQGTLAKKKEFDNEDATEVKDFNFCCLGVAGHICNIPLNTMDAGFMFLEDEINIKNGVPLEIQKNRHSDLGIFPFIQVVACLNDGLDNTLLLKEMIVKPELIKAIVDSNDIGKPYNATFNEIADFIEDNCEFYEEEQK